MGNIRLSAFFSDGMVLQRGVENLLWGYAARGARIKIAMGTYQFEAEAGADGYFAQALPAMPAGGPWEILLWNGTDCVKITDVLFGDVFLLGGQSNMELPLDRTLERFGAEISRTKEENIRMFDLPKEYDFHEKREMLSGGRWVKAKMPELLTFSAAGYFAAKEIADKENVPVGLYQTAVGGTPLKAWTSAETIRKLALDVSELSECADSDYVKRTEQSDAQREQDWFHKSQEPEKENGETGEIQVPCFFSKTALKGFIGSLRLKKTVEIEPQWVGREDVRLYFGAVIDADVISVNGVPVGETTYKYPPRIYPVPKGALRSGRNEIEIFMRVFRGDGGMMPKKEYELRCGDSRIADLTGAWEYEVIRHMPELPDATFFQYKASGLYNAMLYPLRRCRTAGCFFYQGESNTGRPETYEEEFAAMVADWRALFRDPELPFIYVQLAGFSDGIEHPEGTDWARLREAQRRSERIAHTGMAQAYDLGEFNDLHPIDKKSVGKRIALAAEHIIYGRDSIWRGPEMKQVIFAAGRAEIVFELPSEGLSLCIKDGAGKTDAVAGFAAETEGGDKYEVPAKIAGKDRVTAQLPEGVDIAYISYAWNDCPEGNLYHTAGLPALPFRYACGRGECVS